MNIGDKIKSYEFEATSNLCANFDDYRGKWLILYFYPKDSTPGCTIEGENFRDAHNQLKSLNTTVFGISRDNLKSHERFKEKFAFPFELIEDPEEKLCTIFDVMKMKSMYGKAVRGIERSTFIVNPEGVISHIWRKVTVKGHVDEVLNKLSELQNLV